MLKITERTGDMLSTRKKLFISVGIIAFIVVLTLVISIIGYNLIDSNVRSIEENNLRQAEINRIHNQALKQQLGQYEIIINGKLENKAEVERINEELRKIVADYKDRGDLSLQEQEYLAGIEKNSAEFLRNFEEKILPEVEKNKRQELKNSISEISKNTARIFQFESTLRKNLAAAVNETAEKALDGMKMVNSVSADIQKNLADLRNLDPSKEQDREEIKRLTAALQESMASVQNTQENDDKGERERLAFNLKLLDDAYNLMEWSGRMYYCLLEAMFVNEGNFTTYNEAAAKAGQYIGSMASNLTGDSKNLIVGIDLLNRQNAAEAEKIMEEISRSKNSSILDNNKYSIAILGEIDAASRSLYESLDNYISKSIKESKGLQLSLILILSLIIVVSISVGALLAVTTQNIIEYVRKMTKAIDRAGSGDLSVKADVAGNEEVGELARKIGAILEKHKEVTNHVISAEKDIGYLKENFSQIFEESRENINSILKGYHSTLNTIKGSVKYLKDPAKDIHKLIDGIRSVSEVAQQIIDDGTRTMEIAANSGMVVSEIEETIKSITDSIRNVTDTIGQLEYTSRQVGNISNVISDISIKTNLLAENAAVGIQDPPGAIDYELITDEISKLAKESDEASEEIKALVGEIQNQVFFLIDNLSSGVYGVEDSVKKIKTVKNYIEEVVYSTKILVDAMRSTAEKVGEYMESAGKFVDTLNMLDKSVRESTADSEYIRMNLEEQARIVEEMSDLSRILENTSSKLDNVTRKYKRPTDD